MNNKPAESPFSNFIILFYLDNVFGKIVILKNVEEAVFKFSCKILIKKRLFML